MVKKILIVEDEKILLDLLKNKLSGLGYEVIVAIDGQTGFESLKEVSPDLVLLDLIMPKMDGFEFLEKKQEDDSIKDIPVIVISNSGQPVELDRVRQLGVRDWLIKTEFDPQEVVKKVIAEIGESN